MYPGLGTRRTPTFRQGFSASLCNSQLAEKLSDGGVNPDSIVKIFFGDTQSVVFCEELLKKMASYRISLVRRSFQT